MFELMSEIIVRITARYAKKTSYKRYMSILQ